jgi:hypothetical protein
VATEGWAWPCRKTIVAVAKDGFGYGEGWLWLWRGMVVAMVRDGCCSGEAVRIFKRSAM